MTTKTATRLGNFVVLSLFIAMVMAGGFALYKFATWRPEHYRRYYQNRMDPGSVNFSSDDFHGTNGFSNEGWWNIER